MEHRDIFQRKIIYPSFFYVVDILRFVFFTRVLQVFLQKLILEFVKILIESKIRISVFFILISKLQFVLHKPQKKSKFGIIKKKCIICQG
jgi:hypothetical protein